jgi:LytS/YehU family sensor histidine kinase
VTTLLVGSVVASASLVAMVALTSYFSLRLPGEPNVSLLRAACFGLFMGVLHTGVWALAFVYPYVVEDARLRALEADKLRLEAAQLKSAAELSRLRSQLEPHFLLNTLNAIAGLVTEDPRHARRLLVCLGDLLRDSLRDSDELQTLGEEIGWLQRYAQILESRHSGVLEFRWDIDPAASRIAVPRLLLQPLVENAVKHGALRRRSGGIVTVSARATSTGDQQRVVCIVEDNGPGIGSEKPREGAFGLHSVRRRLELRLPDAKLKIESTGSGTRSIVDLPVTREVA